MPLHCMKPMHNVGCYTSSMGQSNPLGPEMRDTRFAAMGIFEKIRLKIWRASIVVTSNKISVVSSPFYSMYEC